MGRVTQPEEPGADFLLVADPSRLGMVVAAVEQSALVAVDTETTGLDPLSDRVRLLAVCTETTDGGHFTYLVDCSAVDPSPLWDALADSDMVMHNAAFDLGFLGRMGFTLQARVHDTMLMAQLLAAGTFDKASLAECCRRHLGVELDKTAQKSDWAGALTPAQLAYAARDAAMLPPLLGALRAAVDGAGLSAVADLEERCLPAVAWMGGNGVALDRGNWLRQARAAEGEAARLRQALTDAAPKRPGEMIETGYNWDSPAQVAEALTLAGCEVKDTSDAALAKLDHPLAALVRDYRGAAKKVSTYGEKWLDRVRPDGRVYPSWKQLETRSGRMSCRNPNMQQLPRGDARRCVVAPPGRVLVKADYSQIELRIAAKVAGDEAMLAAYRNGVDLHTLTARRVVRKEEVTKADRQLAKALNFGLLYGMGARGFAAYARATYGVELSQAQAEEYRSAFFRAYPGLRSWHRRTGASKAAAETRTVLGRRRLDVTSFMEKLNTPVQGTGADGLKLALALLWERRDECPGAFPVLAVHDEIVVECDAEQAAGVEAWLRSAMVEAMAPLVDPVPVEVEVKVGQTWGG